MALFTAGMFASQSWISHLAAEKVDCGDGDTALLIHGEPSVFNRNPPTATRHPPMSGGKFAVISEGSPLGPDGLEQKAPEGPVKPLMKPEIEHPSIPVGSFAFAGSP